MARKTVKPDIATQRVGNAMAFFGFIALPLLLGYAIWMSRRRQSE